MERQVEMLSRPALHAQRRPSWSLPATLHCEAAVGPTHLPMMTSAAMRPCRLAGPARGISAGCSVTQSCSGAAGGGRWAGREPASPPACCVSRESRAPKATDSATRLDLHRVPHRPDAGVAGAHALVHFDAAPRAELQARRLGQRRLGADANDLQPGAGTRGAVGSGAVPQRSAGQPAGHSSVARSALLSRRPPARPPRTHQHAYICRVGAAARRLDDQAPAALARLKAGHAVAQVQVHALGAQVGVQGLGHLAIEWRQHLMSGEGREACEVGRGRWRVRRGRGTQGSGRARCKEAHAGGSPR